MRLHTWCHDKLFGDEWHELRYEAYWHGRCGREMLMFGHAADMRAGQIYLHRLLM